MAIIIRRVRATAATGAVVAASWTGGRTTISRITRSLVYAIRGVSLGRSCDRSRAIQKTINEKAVRLTFIATAGTIFIFIIHGRHGSEIIDTRGEMWSKHRIDEMWGTE